MQCSSGRKLAIERKVEGLVFVCVCDSRHSHLGGSPTQPIYHTVGANTVHSTQSMTRQRSSSNVYLQPR